MTTKDDLTKLNKKLKHPKLLNHILEELDKDHIGDRKQKLFLFLCAISGKQRPNYRFSCAITGDSSEGKDNIWKTVNRHLPKALYLDLTRATGPSLEDDIKEYNTIYFGERNLGNAPIIDTVKQLVEDGIRVMKKDSRKAFKESRYEEQPRKVGIYSTTKDSSDKELATRYCVISVHGNPKKYGMVNRDTLQKAGDIDKQINETERQDKPTWIEEGLQLLKPFNYIIIPYAPLLGVDSRDPRSQRDLKRLLNLIRSITWLCQKNRTQYTHRDYDVLVSSPEDLYNALEIGEEIFNQSYSEIEPRLQRIIDTYHQLVKEGITKEHDDLDIELKWVDRSIIQHRLDIQKVDTIRGHIETLYNLGRMIWQTVGNRVYVAEPTNIPTNNPLITYPKNELYKVISDNWEDIVKESLVGKRQVKRGVKGRSKTSLLSIKTDLPTNTPKNAEDNPKTSIIEHLKEKLVGQNWQVDKPDFFKGGDT